MEKSDRIYVAGHRGLVGSALVRELQHQGFTQILQPSRSELDLLDQHATFTYFRKHRPDYVFLAAAKVGGLYANNLYRADFIYENLQIQCNAIKASYDHGVKKLLFLGSSCIYPKQCPQPMKESDLLTGPLEPTNEPYAIAKIAGLKLCESFNRQYGTQYISVMPTNLYGPNDTYHLENAHVLPALIRKFHVAKMSGAASVEIWGTGQPRREFLYVDDLAKACVFLMQSYSGRDIVNIGTGEELTILALAELIQRVVGFEGQLTFNTDKPDGVARKLLDVSKIHALGWKATTGLEDGIRLAYADFLKNL